MTDLFKPLDGKTHRSYIEFLMLMREAGFNNELQLSAIIKEISSRIDKIWSVVGSQCGVYVRTGVILDKEYNNILEVTLISSLAERVRETLTLICDNGRLVVGNIPDARSKGLEVTEETPFTRLVRAHLGHAKLVSRGYTVSCLKSGNKELPEITVRKTKEDFGIVIHIANKELPVTAFAGKSECKPFLVSCWLADNLEIAKLIATLKTNDSEIDSTTSGIDAYLLFLETAIHTNT